MARDSQRSIFFKIATYKLVIFVEYFDLLSYAVECINGDVFIISTFENTLRMAKIWLNSSVINAVPVTINVFT